MNQKESIVRLLILLQFIFFTYFLILLDANAYSFTEDFDRGIYWQKFPIKVNKFVADQSDGPLLSNLVANAENQWEDAVGIDLWDLSDAVIYSDNYSGNYIRWSYDFENETGYSSFSTLAVTIRYSSGTHFQRTEVILNGNNSSLRSNVNNKLLTVIMHELGHVIGLGHSEESSVMSAYVSSHTSLQDDDVDGAIAVVDEHLYRQSVGFVASFARQNESNGLSLAACGTVDIDPNNGPGGSLYFLTSVMLGFFLVLLSRRTLGVVIIKE